MTGGGIAPTAAPLSILAVDSPRQLEQFLALPMTLYAGARGYAPPLLSEMRKLLDPARSAYFQHAEARFWIASRGGQAVGRISAQIDRLSLERHGAIGYFGFLDAVDDRDVFAALAAAAETWLKERGMVRVRGPFNPSINEEAGLLAEGFDAPPMLMMPYAPPYAGRRLAEQGYAKAKDLIAYDYDMATAKPILAERWLAKAADGRRVRVRNLDKRRYDADLAMILDIFNDAWSENWGFVPFTADEVTQAAQGLRPVLLPDLVWIAEVDGEAASMIVAVPNLAEAIADLGGRLLPTGWVKLLWRLKIKGLRTARVPLFGVRRRYHGTPLGAALGLIVLENLRRTVVRLGFARAELSWILDDNVAARRLIEGVGGRAYKTYRIYEKALA